MRRWVLATVVMAAWVACGEDPFGVTVRPMRSDTNDVLQVSFGVPPGHYLYADTLSVLIRGGDHELAPVARPVPILHQDEFTNSRRECYTNDFVVQYLTPGPIVSDAVIEVQYQGCSETLCYPPAVRVIDFRDGLPRLVENARSQPIETGADWRSEVAGFSIAGRAAGYLNEREFLAFLDRSEGREEAVSAGRSTVVGRAVAAMAAFGVEPVAFLRRFGVGWTLFVIALGGMLLNLTPCVLPMIPINLAIIGAGTQGVSRAKGFFLGVIYGLGMALAYGGLGVVVVLTGAQFGALNSLPLFNLAIALLFMVLALGMFDVISIDLSRFQSTRTGASPRPAGKYLAVLMMGGTSAVLAGACVAPVVIAVLVLSGNLYSQGAWVGLLLPFVLGIGMALPWPLAGGGLAHLPKPGRWMNSLKFGFGLFILVLAVYYAALAYRGWRGAGPGPGAKTDGVRISAEHTAEWGAALAAARDAGTPVLIDFWATWCKNCEAMEVTTFSSQKVTRRLAGYRVVKLQTEDSRRSSTREILDYFDVKGLPSYIVLKPTISGGR